MAAADDDDLPHPAALRASTFSRKREKGGAPSPAQRERARVRASAPDLIAAVQKSNLTPWASGSLGE